MKIFLTLLLATLLMAQEVEEVSKANINSILIFSSESGLNSGIYHFPQIGITLETYHLPFKYHFDSNSSWNYFINGDLSFSRAYVSKHTLEPYSNTLAHDSSIDTYIGGIGGGARYTFGYGLSTSVGFELLYSRAGVKIGQANVEETVKNFFDNNYNENLTYKFETSVNYFKLLDDFKIYADADYRLYETKSGFSLDELKSFHSESSVIGLSTGFETPRITNFGKNYLTVEGRLHEYFLFGTVRHTSGVKQYTSLSSALYLYVPNNLKYIERFFLEVSSVRSENLEGYNVGIGFSIDY